MSRSHRIAAAVAAALAALACTLWLMNGSPSAEANAVLPRDDSAVQLPSSPSAYPVVYFSITPLVVDPAVNEVVQFKFTSDGTVTSMKLALSTGVTVTLAKVGNVFSTTLTHAQVLNGYTASDYNHILVGRLHVYQGATDVGPFGVFVNVKDDQIPDVTSIYTGCFILCAGRQSPHLVNLWMPWLDPANPNVISVTQQFYAYFGDNYDFLSIIYVPERFANRGHAQVKNAVKGIGLMLFDNTTLYGSAGRLQGYTDFPLTDYFDLASESANHELGHQWINYLASASLPQLQNVTPHWPLSSLAHGIMGTQCCANPQGLDFPFTLTPIGGGNYQCNYVGPPLVYNDMELYLMVLAPASTVGAHFVFNNQNQSCGSQLNVPTTPFSVQDVIGAHGARSPSYATAPHKFRMATIIVTQDRYMLSDREMSFFDYFAARGSMMMPLNYSEGFATGVTWPFFLATNRRGCLITTITSNGNCYADYLPLIQH